MSLLEDNKAVLAQIADAGSDLSASRSIDFEHVFANEGAAQEFAMVATKMGYPTEVWQADDGEWNATASNSMAPTAEGITEVEETLAKLAQTVGGKPDGWGFFRTD